MKEKMSWQDAVQNWKGGEIVWSAALGGLGPSYEQCIQILLFEIMARWDRSRPVPEPMKDRFPPEFEDHADKVVSDLNRVYGFSGAQVDVAKATAYQFMHYGYAEMMAKLETDRKIQVSRNFPEGPNQSSYRLALEDIAALNVLDGHTGAKAVRAAKIALGIPL